MEKIKRDRDAERKWEPEPIAKRKEEVRQKLRDLRFGTAEKNLAEIKEELKNADGNKERTEKLLEEKRENEERILDTKEEILKEMLADVERELKEIAPQIEMFKKELEMGSFHHNQKEMIKITDKNNTFLKEKEGILKRMEQIKKEKKKMSEPAGEKDETTVRMERSATEDLRKAA